MAKNQSLNAASKAKEDEFYTQRSDIEREITHYASFFEGKTVYCNCDDPVTSEFWQFFRRNFNPYKLKRLIATHYEPDNKNYAYCLDLSQDTNGDGVIDWNDEPVVTQLPCNGDFRSSACIELLKQADVVVTNPPFSLFREYIAQLIEYDKRFLIIGSQNNVTYKEVFPLLKNDVVWLGYYSGDMAFKVPDYYEPRKTRYWQDVSGQKWRSMGNICWFTNIDIPKRHNILDLRGNYYKSDLYPHYDNYDAIEVSKVDSIPCDYDGVMGVPITFLSKYSPDQFEILGLTSGRDEFEKEAWPTKRYVNAVQHNKNGTTSNGSKANTRATLIDESPSGVFYTADNCNHKLKIVYARILVRNKNPMPRRYPDENKYD